MCAQLNKALIDSFYSRLGIIVPFETIDEIVMSDNNILRPVVGHAFEFIFSEVITKRFCGSTREVGGDTDIDLVVIDRDNKQYETQIKTLRNAGIKNNIKFDVNLHKTHGKEKRPNNLYPIQWPCPFCKHEGASFPDYLVFPHPTSGIMIVPKAYIPESKRYPGHFADPAVFDWDSQWLNRWDLLGFPEYKGQQLERKSVAPQPILNRICQKVNLTYEELLSLWLKPSNFRMIDMNLRGNLREPALKHFLESSGYHTSPPVGAYSKYDIMCNGKRIQIKGTSKSKTFPAKNKLGVEVMGSHGKDAIRRYSTDEFDYLGIVIEPKCLSDSIGLSNDEYHFCLIPTEDLPLHYKNNYEWDTSNKLYDVAAFNVKKQNGHVYLIPSTKYCAPSPFIGPNGVSFYREAVHFRNSNIYEIDSIPF